MICACRRTALGYRDCRPATPNSKPLLAPGERPQCKDAKEHETSTSDHNAFGFSFYFIFASSRLVLDFPVGDEQIWVVV